jgi:hypothetical protein
MDTSALHQFAISINRSLVPIIDHLPFRRLSEVLNEEKPIEFKTTDQGRYFLRYYMVSAPLSITNENRVKVIPISGKFTLDEKRKPDGYNVTQLILSRKGGVGSCLSWYWHEANFKLKPRSISWMECANSTLEFLNQPCDWNNKLIPKKFKTLVENEIADWIDEAISKRRSILRSFQEVRKEFSDKLKV